MRGHPSSPPAVSGGVNPDKALADHAEAELALRELVRSLARQAAREAFITAAGVADEGQATDAASQ